MCGRYTITVTVDELMALYLAETTGGPFHTPRYNVAPMQKIPTIINDGQQNKIGEMRWGLVPVWAKDDKIGSKMINARAESVSEKPAFRTLLTRKRCLIPADGFYEWQKVGGDKQPFRIVLKDRGVFSFAGLYDTWTSPEGEKLSTCTIITTEPNDLMADIKLYYN
jgi:putative SOS response-associated peptidase YedK